LIENGVIKKERSSVLGKGSISGVNSDRFILNPEVRMHLRTQLGYKNDDVVFMFLGRLNIDKGVLDLAKAFHNIQNEFFIHYNFNDLTKNINVKIYSSNGALVKTLNEIKSSEKIITSQWPKGQLMIVIETPTTGRRFIYNLIKADIF
jgi:glycosyltransferase involved in cell wall biosynthesis